MKNSLLAFFIPRCAAGWQRTTGLPGPFRVPVQCPPAWVVLSHAQLSAGVAAAVCGPYEIGTSKFLERSLASRQFHGARILQHQGAGGPPCSLAEAARLHVRYPCDPLFRTAASRG